MRVRATIIPGLRTNIRSGGFAFADDAKGKRYFVHCKEFREQVDDSVLTVGTVLEFEATRDPRGRPYARDIIIVSAPSEDEVLFESLCAGELRDAVLDGGHRHPRNPRKKQDREKRKRLASVSSSFTEGKDERWDIFLSH
jgi:hypothetical protein